MVKHITGRGINTCVYGCNRFLPFVSCTKAPSQHITICLRGYFLPRFFLFNVTQKKKRFGQQHRFTHKFISFCREIQFVRCNSGRKQVKTHNHRNCLLWGHQGFGAQVVFYYLVSQNIIIYINILIRCLYCSIMCYISIHLR